jgi:hypothetical protein
MDHKEVYTFLIIIFYNIAQNLWMRVRLKAIIA